MERSEADARNSNPDLIEKEFPAEEVKIMNNRGKEFLGGGSEDYAYTPRGTDRVKRVKREISFRRRHFPPSDIYGEFTRLIPPTEHTVFDNRAPVRTY